MTVEILDLIEYIAAHALSPAALADYHALADDFRREPKTGAQADAAGRAGVAQAERPAWLDK